MKYLDSSHQQIRLLLAKGLIDEAKETLLQQLEAAPDNIAAWFMLGVAFEDQGEFGRAVEAFETAAGAAQLNTSMPGPSIAQCVVRAQLCRAHDRTQGGTWRMEAAQQAATMLSTAKFDQWLEPEWDRFRDQMALLAVGPLHDYLRMYLGLDPLTNEPCDPNATWYFRGDGQLSDGDRAALDALLGRVARPGLRIAEIGSAIGMGSTRLFAEWVARSGGELICIDPWASIFGIDPRELFDRNMERLGLSDVVTTLQMPSVSAARQIDDHSCDLIFIDGDHRYAAISEDIRLWQSKVRPGGIFCGDDCEGRPTEFDHQELQGNKNNDAVHIARAGSNVMTANVHCGVILAVSEAFGDDCEILGAPPSIWSRDM